jgi:hypothetical protein
MPMKIPLLSRSRDDIFLNSLILAITKKYGIPQIVEVMVEHDIVACDR